MRLVRGKHTVELGAEGAEALLSRWSRLVVDLGTGDGHLPYQLGRQDPHTLYVGLDANAENLRETSARALRKPARGGLENVAFVVADAADPPSELERRADRVLVVLPWGKLMVGLVRGEHGLLAGIARLARPSATLEVVLNGELWGDPVPIEARDLPAPTVEHVRDVLEPIYLTHGIAIHDAHRMSAEQSRAVGTTWAKRLRHGRAEPNFVAFSGKFRSSGEASGVAALAGSST